MHAHHVAPRASQSRGELYSAKLYFWSIFQFFFYPNETWTHPPTSKLFWDFLDFFNFAKPLRQPINRNNIRQQRHIDVIFNPMNDQYKQNGNWISGNLLRQGPNNTLYVQLSFEQHVFVCLLCLHDQAALECCFGIGTQNTVTHHICNVHKQTWCGSSRPLPLDIPGLSFVYILHTRPRARPTCSFL